MQNTLSDLELFSMHLRSGTSLRSALEKAPICFENSARIEKQLWEEVIRDVENGELPAISGVDNFIQFLEVRNTLSEEFSSRIRMPQSQSRVLFVLTLATVVGNSYLLPPAFQPSLELQLSALFWILMGYQISVHLIQRAKKKLWKKDWLFYLMEIRLRLQGGSTLRVSILKTLESKTLKTELPTPFTQLLNSLAVESRDPSLRVEARPQNTTFFKQNPLVIFHVRLLQQSLHSGIPVGDSMETLCSRLAHLIRWELKQITDQLGLWLLVPLFLFYLPAVLFLWLTPFLFEARRALISM